jgi:hypothetical protein
MTKAAARCHSLASTPNAGGRRHPAATEITDESSEIVEWKADA